MKTLQKSSVLYARLNLRHDLFMICLLSKAPSLFMFTQQREAELKPFYTSRNIVYIDNTFLACPAHRPRLL